MLLSALSALARLDLDPWQEAAKLAGLPGETAIQRLASLIAGLPDGPSMHQDPGTIAARLIALLPRPASSNIPSHKALLGAGAVAHPRAVICMYVILMVFALGAQSIAQSIDRPHRSTTIIRRPPAPSPHSCTRRTLASDDQLG